MSKRSHPTRNVPPQANAQSELKKETEENVKALTNIPSSYQELFDYYSQFSEYALFNLRNETMLRIEKITKRPILCFVMKTNHIPKGSSATIEDQDIIGFTDLINSITSDVADVLIISNGGLAETTERIVKLLRGRFKSVRFIVPSNAFSAATMLCLSGDEILMTAQGTLGPIDPQIDGIPARVIIRGFETVQEKLEAEGPKGLPAYVPLLEKYSLHLLEICKTTLLLSKDLAKNWISSYMLKCSPEDKTVEDIVNFFSNFDFHNSHGRSIDREAAKKIGLRIINLDDTPELNSLIISLNNQYEIWFERTPFYKQFENAHGIHWGRQNQAAQNISQ